MRRDGRHIDDRAGGREAGAGHATRGGRGRGGSGKGGRSAAKAAAGRARAAEKLTTEQQQGIEQLQSWKWSRDPIYVDARARLAAAEALMDAAQRGTL